MPRLGPLALLLLVLTAAPAVSQPAADLSLKQTMRHVVNPAAERFWRTSGSTVTEAGVEDRAPTSDAAWIEMVDAAAVLRAAGELLQTPGRGPDDPAWRGFAQQLAEGGAAAMAAAQARDPERAFDAGSEIYAACFGCHRRYIPRRTAAPPP